MVDEEISEEARHSVVETCEFFRCDNPEGENPIDSRTKRGWTVCFVVWLVNGVFDDDGKFYGRLEETLPEDTKVFVCKEVGGVNVARFFAMFAFSHRFASWEGLKEGLKGALVWAFEEEQQSVLVERLYICAQGWYVDEWINHFNMFCDVCLTISSKFGGSFREIDLERRLVDDKLKRFGVLETAGDMWMLRGCEKGKQE